MRGLRSLREQKFVRYYDGHPGGYLLTDVGREQAGRVVWVHRLWELYLTRTLDIAGDHVHDDAESMEHVITPELEQDLLRMLDFPDKDPHEKQIPEYKK